MVKAEGTKRNASEPFLSTKRMKREGKTIVLESEGNKRTEVAITNSHWSRKKKKESSMRAAFKE